MSLVQVARQAATIFARVCPDQPFLPAPEPTGEDAASAPAARGMAALANLSDDEAEETGPVAVAAAADETLAIPAPLQAPPSADAVVGDDAGSER